MSERSLQIHLSVVSIIGTFFLGLAQGDLSLLYLVLAAAITASIFTDDLCWFHLPRPAANLAAILAVGFSLRDYVNSPNQLQLVAIANLLTYLQIVLFFQEKQQRIYWQLITLSLLQVVVSAALSLGLAFGVLAVIYMFVMFSTIKLFYFLRVTQHFQNRAIEKPFQNNAADIVKLAAQPSWKRILGGAPKTEFILSTRDNSTDFLRGISQHVLVAAMMSLVLSATIFYGAPRLSEIQWNAARGSRMRSVGYSSQISLNEMGQVLQDETLAMRVSFYDAHNRPYVIHDEPYLRGAVLTTYAAADSLPGAWDPPKVRQAEFPMPVGEHELVRQIIRLEPTIEPALFGVFPVHVEENTPPEVRFDRRHDQIYRRTYSPPTQFQYVLGTTGFRAGKQLTLLPAEYQGRPISDEFSRLRRLGWTQQFREELTQFNAEKFPQLSALATKVLESAKSTEATAAKKARLLEAHFVDSGRYHYSLQFNQPRDHELDPIEDFVANHRTGHCAYFSTALALMLRSQNIPARVIVGYHGGEFNHVGNYWLVRQRHAHAWVEAYLEPHDLLDFPADSQRLSEGAWLRLDPTPSLLHDSLLTQSSGGWDWSSVVGYLHFLWSDYVLGLNAERQQMAVYSPMEEKTKRAVLEITDLQGWREWLLGPADKNKKPDEVRAPWKLEDWFNWRAAVLGSLVCAFGFAVWQLIQAIRGRHTRTRKLLRRLRGLFGVRFSDEQLRVEFYHRFEAICARLGWRRPACQTQREFVAAIRGTAGLTSSPTSQLAAQRIVETFYRIRFGDEEIAEPQMTALHEDLRTVEASLEKDFSTASPRKP